MAPILLDLAVALRFYVRTREPSRHFDTIAALTVNCPEIAGASTFCAEDVFSQPPQRLRPSGDSRNSGVRRYGVPRTRRTRTETVDAEIFRTFADRRGRDLPSERRGRPRYYRTAAVGFVTSTRDRYYGRAVHQQPVAREPYREGRGSPRRDRLRPSENDDSLTARQRKPRKR